MYIRTFILSAFAGAILSSQPIQAHPHPEAFQLRHAHDRVRRASQAAWTWPHGKNVDLATSLEATTITQVVYITASASPTPTEPTTSQDSSAASTQQQSAASSSSSSPSSAASSAPSSAAPGFLRGINVGGWLIVEKWMTPSLFNGTSAVDQMTFDQTSGAKDKLQQHWDSYFTQADVQRMAGYGLNA